MTIFVLALKVEVWKSFYRVHNDELLILNSIALQCVNMWQGSFYFHSVVHS